MYYVYIYKLCLRHSALKYHKSHAILVLRVISSSKLYQGSSLFLPGSLYLYQIIGGNL